MASHFNKERVRRDGVHDVEEAIGGSKSAEVSKSLSKKRARIAMKIRSSFHRKPKKSSFLILKGSVLLNCHFLID